MSLTAEDVRVRLHQSMGEQSLRDFARKNGMSAAYLSDVLAAKRGPGPKILALLGLHAVRTTVYVGDAEHV